MPAIDLDEYIKAFVMERINFLREFIPLYARGVSDIAKFLGMTFTLVYEYPFDIWYESDIPDGREQEIKDIFESNKSPAGWSPGVFWKKKIGGNNWHVSLTADHLIAKYPQLIHTYVAWIELYNRNYRFEPEEKSRKYPSSYKEFDDFMIGLSPSYIKSETHIVYKKVKLRLEKMSRQVVNRYRVVR